MRSSDGRPENQRRAGGLFARLAGDRHGEPDDRAPLVLVHGLTFDRSMWGPVLAELAAIDPGRQVLALDLPGHGESPSWESYDMESVAEALHQAVQQAGLSSPVVVGHSYSAVMATVYAARYPARGVVNVDQWLQVEPIAELAQSLAAQLRGPGFLTAWRMFEVSMRIELLPAAAQDLVRSTCRPRQDVVTGYWRELLDTPVADMAARAAAGLEALRASAVPYVFVAGHELEAQYEEWLTGQLPQVSVAVWPGSGHFPHLAHPRRFAGCLAATARRGSRANGRPGPS